MTDNGARQHPVTGRFGGRVQLSATETQDGAKQQVALDQLVMSIGRRLLRVASDKRQMQIEIAVVCDITLANPEDARVGEHVSELSALSLFKPSGDSPVGDLLGESLSFRRQETGLWERVK